MKKNLIYILLILLAACAEAKKEPEMMENDIIIEASPVVAIEDFQYQNISKQKLQDLFDLLILQKNHPEFYVDITTQLNEISKDNISVSDKIENVLIENISMIEPIRKVSDSIKTMKIDFDRISNLGVLKDSLLVIIKTEQIIIDEDELESTSITFKKIE